MTGLPDRQAWALDPAVAYLNHGGFGAAPVVVLEAQREWLARLEANPTDFLMRQLAGLLDVVRKRLAEFLGADPGGLAFVENATSGVQTVIRNLELREGDEVLATDHVYPAVLRQLTAATAAGARLRVVPFAPSDWGTSMLADAVESALTERTRLVVVDHVTSPTALVLPVGDVVAVCRRRGVPVLVDGAHALGMLPVSLADLDADFWVGNLHKWLCAPKSGAVLYAADAWRSTMRPLVASHWTPDTFPQVFDWAGTRDPSAILASVTALEFFEHAGWERVRRRNNELAEYGAQLVGQRLGDGPLPGGDFAAMRVIPLPGSLSDEQARLLEMGLAERGIVVPVTQHGDRRWLRVSAQLYNTERDYERLAETLPGALAELR